MTFADLFASTDWNLVLGLCGLIFVLVFVKTVEGPLPPPDRSITPQTDLRVTSGGRS